MADLYSWHAHQAVELYTYHHEFGPIEEQSLRAELLDQARKVLAQAQSEEKMIKATFNEEMHTFIKSHGRRPATVAAPKAPGHKLVKLPQSFVNRQVQAVKTAQIEAGYKPEL